MARTVVAAAAEAAAKAEVAAAVARVEEAIAVAVVRAAVAGRVEAARAATAVVEIANAPVITVPGAVAVAHRVGPAIVVETVIEVATETVIVTVIGTETVIEIGTEIVIVIATVTGIEIGIVMIASIAAHVFTNPLIMATIDIAPTLMTVAIRTVYTRAQTTRAEGRAMTRSVHTFTGMVLMASLLLSVTEAVIERLIGMASYVVMKKDSNISRCTSTGEAFIGSDS